MLWKWAVLIKIMRELSSKKKNINSLLLASRITGSIIAGSFGLFGISHIIQAIYRDESYLPMNDPWQGVVMTTAILLVMAGYLISWKKEGIGGIIMIIAGLSVCLPFIIILGNFGALLFGLPLTIAGLLYVIYWNDMSKSKKIKSPK